MMRLDFTATLELAIDIMSDNAAGALQQGLKPKERRIG